MGPLDHAIAIGAALDALEIPWVLGGSMAGSIVGEPRSTNDIDVAVRLLASQANILVEAMEGFYLAPLVPRQEAARQNGSFNLIQLDTGFKVDLFFLGDTLLDQWQMTSRERVDLPDLEASIWVTADRPPGPSDRGPLVNPVRDPGQHADVRSSCPRHPGPTRGTSPATG